MRPLLGQPTSDSSSGFFGNIFFRSRARSRTNCPALSIGMNSQYGSTCAAIRSTCLASSGCSSQTCHCSDVVTGTFTAARTRSSITLSSAAVISLRKIASLPTTTRTTLREELAISMARVISRSLRSWSGLIQIPRVTRKPNSSASFGMFCSVPSTE
ncbi:hypothetical protein D3C84_718100 [compost metagenome]